MDQKTLVWAKMKRYAPWPGIVVNVPTPELLRKAPKQKNVKCIFFFGSKNFAWIEDCNVKPFDSHRENLSTTSKTIAFKEAVARVLEYIEDPIKYKSNAEADPVTADERNADAEFNKLRSSNSDESGLDEASALESAESSVEASSSPVVTSTSKTSVAASTPTAPASKAASRSGSIKSTASRRKVSPKKEQPMKFKVGAKKPREETDHTAGPTPKRKRSTSIASNTHQDAAQSTPPSSSMLIDADPAPAPRRNPTAYNNLISRPYVVRPESEEINLNDISVELRSRHIVASELRFGFMGLGVMGAGMVKNLINTGHKVVVWNRTFSHCHKFTAAGATTVATPADVIDAADIIFSCVSNPTVAKEMVFGNCGVLSSETLGDRKGYVEMTGIDDHTSQDISDAIVNRGGRYLEAQLQGSKKEAEDGTLVILAGGDRGLYDESQSCFEAMCNSSFFLGDVGTATKMYMVMQVLHGVSLAGLAEAMALAMKTGVNLKTLLDVMKNTKISSPMLLEKANAMVENNYETSHSLMHLQKDLHLALSLSDSVEQSLPLTAVANEVYKQAKRNGYADHDTSSVFVKSIH